MFHFFLQDCTADIKRIKMINTNEFFFMCELNIKRKQIILFN